MKNYIKKYLFIFIFAIIGGIGGWGYWKFFGCTNGCPLQSNSLFMIIYGVFGGGLLGSVMKNLFNKKINKQKES